MVKNKLHFLGYLAGLSIIGLLSTDMYLPAFGAMRDDLNTNKSVIAASLSVFLGGYAFAQLFWGPIADKYGKPKVIVWGLSLFTLASICVFFTSNIVVLLGLRLVQAIGVCSATVSWQALVVDRYPKSKVQKIFASIMPLVALSPALAPLLGVFVLQHLGWRYIFLVLAFLALLLIAYSLTLRDFWTKSRQTNSISEEKKAGLSYRTFLQSRYYLGNVLIYALCSAAFFAWLTGAPFFLKNLGYSESEIGLSFIPQTVTFLIAGYAYSVWSDKLNTNRLLPYLLAVYAFCMCGLLGLATLTTPSLGELLIPFSVMSFVNGVIYPIVVAQAMQVFPKHSGKASALQNTIQLGACFIASVVVSLFPDNILLTTTVVMTSTVGIVYLGYALTLPEFRGAIRRKRYLRWKYRG